MESSGESSTTDINDGLLERLGRSVITFYKGISILYGRSKLWYSFLAVFFMISMALISQWSINITYLIWVWMIDSTTTLSYPINEMRFSRRFTNWSSISNTYQCILRSSSVPIKSPYIRKSYRRCWLCSPKSLMAYKIYLKMAFSSTLRLLEIPDCRSWVSLPSLFRCEKD